MQTENRYVKIFQPLLKAVAEDRQRADKTALVVASYAGAIIKMRERIQQMQQLAPKVLKSRDGEIIYFREIWPRMFGHLFYYQKAHDFLTERALVSTDGLAILARREQYEARRFFRRHWEFWLSYASGSTVINDQFSRAYSRECIHDPLSLVIDAGGATLASLRVAWGLAYTDYLVLLDRGVEKAQPAGEEVDGLDDFAWGCSDADAVEWLYSLHAGSVILHKGEPADIAHLGRWYKLNFRKEIVNIYDRFKAVRNRKKDRAPFMRRLLGGLEKRMDHAEGKFS